MKASMVLLVAAFAVSARPAHAQAYQEYFPLRQGNQWTFNTSGSNALPSMRVSARVGAMAYLTGFPGSQEGMWVMFTANTLRAWDPNDRAWEPLFRFSAAVGTTYTVSLPSPSLTNVEFTVEAKNVEHTSAVLSQSFTNCIRIRVGHRFRWSGLSSFIFAPRVGLVHWVEDNVGTFTQHRLMAAQVDGMNVGLIPFTVRERYTDSRFFFADRYLALINDQDDWVRFYAAHRPGARPFSVDFSRQTVLVVLVERQLAWDAPPEVTRVRWNLPANDVTAFVRGVAPQWPTFRRRYAYNPFVIVVLSQKVFGTPVFRAD